MLLVLLMLLGVSVHTAMSDNTSVSQLISRGDTLLGNDKLDEAISAYKLALSNDPESSEAHQRLATAFCQLGDYGVAINENQKALKLNASNALAHSNLGWIYGIKHRFADAVIEERKAVALDPNNTDALLTLALACASLGDYDRAITENLRVIQLSPDNLRAYINLGACLGRKGDIDHAVMVYRYAMKLSAGSAQAHLGLAAALGKLGDYMGQLKELRTATALSPDSDSAHGRLGWALYKAGHWEGALREGAIANWIRLKRSGPQYFHNMAFLWANIFLVFGLLFAVIFVGSHFTPEPDETLVKSYLLTFYGGKPGRFTITSRRLVFVPEAFSKWFGTPTISMDRDQIEAINSVATSTGGHLTIHLSGGKTHDFSIPAVILKPLMHELSATKNLREPGTAPTPVNAPDDKAQDINPPV